MCKNSDGSSNPSVLQTKPSNVQIQILVWHIPPTVLMDLFLAIFVIVQPPISPFPSLLFLTPGCSITASFLPYGPISTGFTSNSPQLPLSLSIFVSDSHTERNQLALNAEAGWPPPHHTCLTCTNYFFFTHVHPRGGRGTSDWDLESK